MKKCKKQKKNAGKSKGNVSRFHLTKKVKSRLKSIVFWVALIKELYGVAKELLEAIFSN